MEVKWLTSSPCRSVPEIITPVPIVQEDGWTPGPVWTGAESIVPTGIRYTDRPTRSESLYRLRYPSPHFPIIELNLIHGNHISYRLETNTFCCYVAAEVPNIHYEHTQVQLDSLIFNLHFFEQAYCHC